MSDRSQIQPPLLLRAQICRVGHARYVFQAEDLDVATLQADERAGCRSVFSLGDQELDAARRQPGCLDAIERRGVAALLKVPQDRLPHIEEVAALLLEQRGHEA